MTGGTAWPGHPARPYPGDVLERLRRPVSPQAYRTITMVALVLLVAIVVTGAGVRLTGSGLGCTDWPRCTEETFTPSSDLHAKIEFYNRMITGLVSVAVILAVLAGGQLFGFFGVLLALPVAAVILVVLRHTRERYLASDIYGAEATAPADATPASAATADTATPTPAAEAAAAASAPSAPSMPITDAST